MSLIGSLSSIFRAPHVGSPLSEWRRRLMPSLVAAATGVGLSVTAAIMISSVEDRHAKKAFDVVAENHFLVLQNALNEYLNKLRAMRAFFSSSDDAITRGEFETFARPILRYSSAIQTLSWVPRVRRPERAAHELAAVRDGLSGYRIKAVAPDRSMAPSSEQEEYFPIFYATVPKTSRLYGLDLRSEPATLAELEHARDGDQLGFSEVPELVSAGGSQHGFIFSLPLYRRGAPNDTVEDRRRNLVGFVHGSLITARMIGPVIDSLTTPQGVDLFFYKPDTGPQEPPLHVHGSRLRTQPIGPKPQVELSAGVSWSRAILADNDPWMTMVAVPMPEGPLMARHDRAWIIFIFGLIITGVVVAYMWTSSQHASRLVLANKRMSELATTDALTMLANRRTFLERLNLAFAACQRGSKPFAVLYFDLDQFKDINDSLGHPIGDALLRQVADRVKATVRDNDLVARFGGDEFSILQSDVADLTAAGTLADKIRQTIAAPYVIEDNEIHITVSIGISRYSPEIAGPNAMMIQADLALYRAKEDGRNCFRFHSEDLDQQVLERVKIADELREALDREELELFYQPQVELISGRIIGVEALLRWNHPVRGSVPPSVFIPIAERTGFIIPLGQWVLDAACRQLSLWQQQGVAPVHVAVNFSAAQFKGSSNLERDVAATLDKWGIASSQIEIELTESMLMEVTHQHGDDFERVRNLGISIAIDDFGTGYSSLNYLTRYPVNRLKIAQELVFGVDTDSRSATVVRTAIRLAHELGIEIIAEGVETETQAKFLIAAGCEHGQGYYFSRPVNAKRATELLRKGRIKPAWNLFQVVEKTVA